MARTPRHRQRRRANRHVLLPHRSLDGAPEVEPKGRNTQRSLITLVGKRRRLLDYLKRKDIERYRAIVKDLGLRR